jgi:DNA-binding protein HU-beta
MAAAKVMGKADLIDAVAKAADVTKKDATEVIGACICAIEGALKKGVKVQITGFGTFEAAKRKKRTARNPRTGETITIPATTVPRFKPGQGLKDAVAGK